MASNRPESIRVALASPPFAAGPDAAMAWVERYVAEAAMADAAIVCFPESYVPGYRGEGFDPGPHDPHGLRTARDRACAAARGHGIAIILPMEWPSAGGVLNTAFVISPDGQISGSQAKAILAPSEDGTYVSGTEREVFEVGGLRFGISICIEGWRYPETVRWAARRGADVVFHPTLAGSGTEGALLKKFLEPDGPYYEKAMVCRAAENGIYFASVNYALAFQEAATAVIDPDGVLMQRLPYREPGLLVVEIEPGRAHRTYASRYDGEA